MNKKRTSGKHDLKLKKKIYTGQRRVQEIQEEFKRVKKLHAKSKPQHPLPLLQFVSEFLYSQFVAAMLTA